MLQGGLPLRVVPSPPRDPAMQLSSQLPLPGWGTSPEGRPRVLCPFVMGVVSKTKCSFLKGAPGPDFKGSGKVLPRKLRAHTSPAATCGLTLASGVFLSLLGEDAGEDEGGSGESPSPSGTHPQRSGHSCVACPALGHIHLCPQQGSGAGKSVSQLLGLARGKGQHLPGLSLSASQQTEAWVSCVGSWPWKLWDPAASSLPSKVLGAVWPLLSGNWPGSLPQRVQLGPIPLPAPSAGPSH